MTGGCFARMITQVMRGRGHYCIPEEDWLLSLSCMVLQYAGAPEEGVASNILASAAGGNWSGAASREVVSVLKGAIGIMDNMCDALGRVITN